MKKIDEIKNYLTENAERTKEYLLERLMKNFEISRKSAETYYYIWKKEYMESSETKNRREEAKKVAEEVIRQTEKALSEASLINNKKDETTKDDEVIKSETVVINTNTHKFKIKKIELKGNFGEYIKEGDKVIVGEITFNSLEDVEEYYKKEIELFNKRIEEIREVYKFS